MFVCNTIYSGVVFFWQSVLNARFKFNVLLLNCVHYSNAIMSRGGKRPNSGPKKSMSPYGEKTTAMRIPNSVAIDIANALETYKAIRLAQSLNSATNVLPASLSPLKLLRPIYSGTVQAGQSRFPSPAQDYEQKFLDLNERYISNPPATFFFEVKGNSMEGAGIFEGDTVIVDRALKPKSSSIVIAAVDGEWMVKRLYKRGDTVKLLSEHPDHAPIAFSEGQELTIFGVVTYVIHQPK
ncbi:LexA family protein [Methylophilus sp. 'Pure River']|uniref:LexA family protein n=1 Tax=Methylophilus sp. 'Pure River' TaxID=3377117 RepID=UPI00398E5BEB